MMSVDRKSYSTPRTTRTGNTANTKESMGGFGGVSGVADKVDKTRLMTDRGAYLNFLEVQLERVSSSCLTVQGFSERIEFLQAQTNTLEEKLLNCGRLIKMMQTYNEEVNRVAENIKLRVNDFSEEVEEKMISRLEALELRVNRKIDDHVLDLNGQHERLTVRHEEHLENHRKDMTTHSNSMSKIADDLGTHHAVYQERLEKHHDMIRETEKICNRLCDEAAIAIENNERKTASFFDELRQHFTQQIKELEQKLMKDRDEHMVHFVAKEVEKRVALQVGEQMSRMSEILKKLVVNQKQMQQKYTNVEGNMGYLNFVIKEKMDEDQLRQTRRGLGGKSPRCLPHNPVAVGMSQLNNNMSVNNAVGMSQLSNMSAANNISAVNSMAAVKNMSRTSPSPRSRRFESNVPNLFYPANTTVHASGSARYVGGSGSNSPGRKIGIRAGSSPSRTALAGQRGGPRGASPRNSRSPSSFMRGANNVASGNANSSSLLANAQQELMLHQHHEQYLRDNDAAQREHYIRTMGNPMIHTANATGMRTSGFKPGAYGGPTNTGYDAGPSGTGSGDEKLLSPSDVDALLGGTVGTGAGAVIGATVEGGFNSNSKSLERSLNNTQSVGGAPNMSSSSSKGVDRSQANQQGGSPDSAQGPSSAAQFGGPPKLYYPEMSIFYDNDSSKDACNNSASGDAYITNSASGDAYNNSITFAENVVPFTRTSEKNPTRTSPSSLYLSSPPVSSLATSSKGTSHPVVISDAVVSQVVESTNANLNFLEEHMRLTSSEQERKALTAESEIHNAVAGEIQRLHSQQTAVVTKLQQDMNDEIARKSEEAKQKAVEQINNVRKAYKPIKEYRNSNASMEARSSIHQETTPTIHVIPPSESSYTPGASSHVGSSCAPAHAYTPANSFAYTPGSRRASTSTPHAGGGRTSGTPNASANPSHYPGRSLAGGGTKVKGQITRMRLSPPRKGATPPAPTGLSKADRKKQTIEELYKELRRLEARQ